MFKKVAVICILLITIVFPSHCMAFEGDTISNKLEISIIAKSYNNNESGRGGGGISVETLVIDETDPPDGIVNKPYTYKFTASGGKPPYIFKIKSGILPDGLKLDENGTLSGIPTTEGNYSYTIEVSDQNNKSSKHTFSHIIKKDISVSPIQKKIIFTIGSRHVKINEQLYTLDTQPFIDTTANRVLVPIRFIGEMLGAKVEWNSETKQIRVNNEVKEIVFTLNSKNVLVNEEIVTIDCVPRILPPGRTFVPLRFVSEIFDATVEYDNETKQITIMQ